MNTDPNKLAEYPAPIIAAALSRMPIGDNMPDPVDMDQMAKDMAATDNKPAAVEPVRQFERPPNEAVNVSLGTIRAHSVFSDGVRRILEREEATLMAHKSELSREGEELSAKLRDVNKALETVRSVMKGLGE